MKLVISIMKVLGNETLVNEFQKMEISGIRHKFSTKKAVRTLIK